MSNYSNLTYQFEFRFPFAELHSVIAMFLRQEYQVFANYWEQFTALSWSCRVQGLTPYWWRDTGQCRVMVDFYIYATGLGTTSIRLEIRGKENCSDKDVVAQRDAFVERLKSHVASIQVSDTYGTRPTKPPPAAPRDEFFQYYFDCRRAGIRYTHAQMAVDIRLSESSTRKQYSTWKAGHG